VSPSRRLRRSQVEDGLVDATDCVGLCYHIFTVFYILDSSSILVIYPFVWSYIYDPREIELLDTFQFYFCIYRIEVSKEHIFSFQSNERGSAMTSVG
jgi:hypothetical protein